MSKTKPLNFTGIVYEALPNANFRVELENGHKVLAHISGKIRQNFVKIVPHPHKKQTLRVNSGKILCNH